jgi:DNA-binding MarR family transcriptional regulator
MSRAKAERLNRLLRDISTETILLHQAIAGRLGLNLTDHKGMGLMLDAGKPLTAGDLARRMGLTTGAVTGIVDRLERAGYVKRVRDPYDRRRVSLELQLPKIRREVLPLFEQLARRMATVAGSYSDKELDLILRFLEQGLAISREQRQALAHRAAQ